jgi:hypothetical protein
MFCWGNPVSHIGKLASVAAFQPAGNRSFGLFAMDGVVAACD